MTKNTRPTYSTEFKLEAAQLVVDGDHSVREAAELMNVSKSAMDKWVRQLKQERKGTNKRIMSAKRGSEQRWL